MDDRDPRTIREIIAEENAGPLAEAARIRQEQVDQIMAEDAVRLQRLIAERYNGVWWKKKSDPPRAFMDPVEEIELRRAALLGEDEGGRSD